MKAFAQFLWALVVLFVTLVVIYVIVFYAVIVAFQVVACIGSKDIRKARIAQFKAFTTGLWAKVNKLRLFNFMAPMAKKTTATSVKGKVVNADSRVKSQSDAIKAAIAQ